MTAENIQEQLTKYLADAHSIEQQALAQMRSAPRIAGDPQIAAAFADHERETREHERLVQGRLHARGANAARVKDLVGSLTGRGFLAFARVQPDTPGKLVAHAFSYEHMELAAYELLAGIAARADDARTVEVAGEIAGQERAMGERLAGLFEGAAHAALRAVEPDSLHDQLDKYLADAHAIEMQALTLLAKAPALAGPPELAAAYEEHRSQTEEHEWMVSERLRERGSAPSRLKDAALRLGALNWGAFFRLQPDTPAKLAAFCYAFEHLEIAAYELLGHVAVRAGDLQTRELVQRILVQEREAAERIHSLLEPALDATLRERLVAA